MDIRTELLKNSGDRLKSIVAIGLASAALTSCGQQAHAEERSLPAITVPSAVESPAVINVPPTINTQSYKPNVITQLKNDWKAIIDGSPGDVDIAVYDDTTGQVAEYSNVEGATFDTASIVKLSILEELLLQYQAQGKSLADEDQASSYADATEMIENSDNDAASDLWNQEGGAPAMNDFYRQIGALTATAGTDGYWGNTQVTAVDQIKIVSVLADAGTPLSPLSESSAEIANELLNKVEPDQHWGVSAGPPSNVFVDLKNGWLQDAMTTDPYNNTDDWVVNSTGYIKGKYRIAILTRGNPTEQDGIKKIEDLSVKTWTDLNAMSLE